MAIRWSAVMRPAGSQQEPGHAIRAMHRAERRAHQTAAVRDELDLGGQEPHQGLDVTLSAGDHEPLGDIAQDDGVRLESGSPRIDVSPRPEPPS